VGFTWLGVRRTLSAEQRREAAEPFGAEGTSLSAAKKLLDTRDPAYRAVTAVRGRAVAYWRGVSLPYPEPGLRLLRREGVADFDARMRELSEELAEAVGRLEERYAGLKEAAGRRLGRLYDERDYPSSLSGLFALHWDFPSVEPPQYLLRLDPQLYAREAGRVVARFDEAVRLAESAFAAEFAQLVSHLAERLDGTQDGKPKSFRDSAVENLSDFFGRFRSLNVSGDGQLDELVERARQAVAGVRPQALRETADLRQRVRGQLDVVRAGLENLLVDRPRRRVLRKVSTGEGGGKGVASCET
jgi:hypothetical protein